MIFSIPIKVFRLSTVLSTNQLICFVVNELGNSNNKIVLSRTQVVQRVCQCLCQSSKFYKHLYVILPLSIRITRFHWQSFQKGLKGFRKIKYLTYLAIISRSSRAEVFLVKGVLKTCIKFTGEHLCRSAISINMRSNFIGITLQHGQSPANVIHVFRTPFTKNTSGWLLLNFLVIDVTVYYEIQSQIVTD